MNEEKKMIMICAITPKSVFVKTSNPKALPNPQRMREASATMTVLIKYQLVQ